MSTLPPPRLSQRAQWAEGQAIAYLMQQGLENRDVISLAAGFVDEGSLPVQLCRASTTQLLNNEAAARSALQYGTTAGNEQLRAQLINHLARLEGTEPSHLAISPEQLVVTTGSQNCLSLLAEVLFDPGDICLVAMPTYFVFLGVLNGVGAQTIGVETDSHGMNPEALDETLRYLHSTGQLSRVKLIYLVSYYENPSGVSLAAERRPAILEIARRWSQSHPIYVLEDAAYRELRYAGPVLPSLWSFDQQHEQVILTQTFSKSFAPGIRTGFGVFPKPLVKAIINRKGNEDFGSSHWNQQLLSTVLASQQYAAHVDEVRGAYRLKRDAMLAAADEYFRELPGVEWVTPDGGLYVWMTLPPTVPTGFTQPLFKEAVRRGVMYVPGELCYPTSPQWKPLPATARSQMRLSFGVESPAQIRLGMSRLADAIRAVSTGT